MLSLACGDGRPADIFSCGAALHTMLCLAPPWRAAKPGDVWPYWENFCADPASHAHQQFWQNKRPTSAAAQEFMRRLMRNDPAQRLSVQDANQMLDAVGNANLKYVVSEANCELELSSSYLTLAPIMLVASIVDIFKPWSRTSCLLSSSFFSMT